MAVSRPSEWRRNLALFVLICLLAACGILIWQRRVPWHQVGALPGSLAPQGCLVPYVFDPNTAMLTFTDTQRVLQLPREYQERASISRFPASRSAFEVELEAPDGSHSERRCWNVAAHREVPLPALPNGRWSLSASGTRVLVLDVPDEGARCVQVLGLDGAVLRKRTLPAGDRPLEAHAFTPEGNFLIVTRRDYQEGDKTLVYDLFSERNWSFADRFGALSDEGLLWLRDSSQEPSRTLHALLLPAGRQLWKTEIPGGVESVAYLGKDRLAVDTPSRAMFLLDARSGRILFPLESAPEPESTRTLEIREGGSVSRLAGFDVAWSLETGRLLPLKGPVRGIQFFDDGRRALINVKCGWPGRVVEAETGEELFLFQPPPPAVVGGHVRLSGDRVLLMEGEGPVQIWERRHREGWTGQLLRPEVLGAIVLAFTIVAVGTAPRRAMPA